MTKWITIDKCTLYICQIGCAVRGRASTHVYNKAWWTVDICVDKKCIMKHGKMARYCRKCRTVFKKY